MPWRRRVLLETGEEVWLSSPLLLLYLTLQLKTGLVWEVHFFPLLSYFSVADKKKKKTKATQVRQVCLAHNSRMQSTRGRHGECEQLLILHAHAGSSER